MKWFLLPLSVYTVQIWDAQILMTIETNNFLSIYSKKIELSISSDSFTPYIDVLKLLLSVTAFDITSSLNSAINLFKKFAQYNKPFENATEFAEAVELHDELCEITSKYPEEVALEDNGSSDYSFDDSSDDPSDDSSSSDVSEAENELNK